MHRRHITVDGNEAAAQIAHLANEVIAIYPITPASPMGELADAWSNAGRTNIFGAVPDVIEMQSEGGAAGAVHGSLQAGALTTTFTASQGLLLMIPNMFKIAGELTPTVFHIACRSVATHALSIFGDHSDIMATRSCGWAMLGAGTIQEVHDFALIAQAATLRSRVPFLHFFDGFRTSHEINRIEQLTPDDVREMIDAEFVQAHRDRALNPDRPVLRGSAQNPDVFFQAREAINPFYAETPGIVQQMMDRFAELTGRRYRLFDYVGAPDAERVIVLMGSGCGAAEEAVRALNERGEKVGMIKVRLYRPFCAQAFVDALPATTKSVAVLDRTKEPGATGEPLYLDALTALTELREPAPRVVGGRYGLSCKEFTPAMAMGVFRELEQDRPRRRFTVGIIDDVTHLSLKWEPDDWQEPADINRCVFYGLGSDGTVSANKNSVKIIGEETPLHAQGYFVYDSRKSGSQTVSHLRFSSRPIHSSYLIDQANFVACHQWQFLESRDVLSIAAPKATFLLNSPYPPEAVWDEMPAEVQQHIIDKELDFYVVDAYEVARAVGLGGRINTVMQTCFFALTDILPTDEAVQQIKAAIPKSYGKRGKTVIEKNFAAVDAALAGLNQIAVPQKTTSAIHMRRPVPETSPDFVQRVTSMMLSGRGDLLPVSALPVDGTFPTGTTRYEKRSIAQEIPIWDPDICIECGMCALVCPHAVIRTKAYGGEALDGAPSGFLSKEWTGKDLPDSRMTIQVAPDDCTGCGVCVDVCPARSKEVARHKAINMEPKQDHIERERINWEHFLTIPEIDRSSVPHDEVKGSQLLQPLFEFSGACAGCGETPYLKLLTQLFGDRILVANATGCSSIYGGNLPTTPWSMNADGRGPAWSNSLFEDNGEFGLGMRLALDHSTHVARETLKRLASLVGEAEATEILNADQSNEDGINRQRRRVETLKERLIQLDTAEAQQLAAMAAGLVRRSVWIVGGDGWAYDIGFGGLDHVLASGRNVNVLVLDTEVYSNTGGQASKSTPRAAVAKFAAGGKKIGKKDLGMIAIDYGSVYVATVALGANPAQTIRAFHEAESYNGPSLLIAYSQCIAHGIDMTSGMTHQREMVKSGYWPLYRYDPRLAHDGAHPFHLDSHKPSIPFRQFAEKEARYAMLQRSAPHRAEELFAMAQEDINERWRFYEQMADVERTLIQTGEQEP